MFCYSKRKQTRTSNVGVKCCSHGDCLPFRPVPAGAELGSHSTSELIVPDPSQINSKFLYSLYPGSSNQGACCLWAITVMPLSQILSRTHEVPPISRTVSSVRLSLFFPLVFSLHFLVMLGPKLRAFQEVNCALPVGLQPQPLAF